MRAYVSSTYEDLKAYRAAVIQALRRVNITVAGMEDYGSEGRYPLQKCLEDIDTCDVYIGIFAWRYGYVPDDFNPDRKSITELEYRQALNSGKECLIFLLDADQPWMPGHIDCGDTLKKIKDFRNELQTRHTRALFREPSDLANQVLSAIHNLSKRSAVFPDAIIEVVNDDGSRSAHRLFKGRPFVVGRGPDADVMLTDRVVSRAHAEFSVDEGGLIVRDLQSKNGTYVDAKRITEQMLGSGDVVRFGAQGPAIRVILAPGEEHTIEG